MKLFLSAVLAAASIASARAALASDAVPTVPDYGKPPAAQYSGFLNASAVEDGTFLHYWYAAYEGTATADTPVVLWMNGGPGSSSILGMLQEHGPLLVNATGGLMQNQFAWTKLAHLVVLESPAGVGYSYCKATTTGGSCHNTDKSTARAARAAMVDFFDTKFPELKKNPFYITGESYAGVYVPTLSKEILDNTDINMKGLAVGDPCTDNTAQKDSMDMLWYGHKYGFVPDAEFDLLWNNCSSRHPSMHMLGKWGASVTEDDVTNMRTAHRRSVVGDAPMSPECELAERKFLMSTSKGFSQGWDNAWINDLTLYGPAALVTWGAAGSLNAMTAAYMNRADVKAALHVDKAPSIHAWPGPSDGWTYESQYDACNSDVAPGTPSMIDFYREIAPKLETTVVFNGDTDPCVSYEGTRQAIIEVGFDEIEGGSYRPWFFNATAVSEKLLAEKPLLYGPSLALQEGGSQFGGHIVNFENNLNFVTVHGSGHMVPQFRPRAAIHMLDKVLFHKAEMSPLLAADAALTNMTNGEYSTFLDKWTVSAKAAPFVGPLY